MAAKQGRSGDIAGINGMGWDAACNFLRGSKMLKACSYCGRIHDSKFVCKQKKEYMAQHQRAYQRSDAEKERYGNRWKKLSDRIKSDANYLCEACRANGRYTYDTLETHHIEKITESQKLVYDESNLICLCRRHHEAAESGSMSKETQRALAKDRIMRTNRPPQPVEK